MSARNLQIVVKSGVFSSSPKSQNHLPALFSDKIVQIHGQIIFHELQNQAHNQALLAVANCADLGYFQLYAADQTLKIQQRFQPAVCVLLGHQLVYAHHFRLHYIHGQFPLGLFDYYSIFGPLAGNFSTGPI